MEHGQADGVRLQPWQVPRPREGRTDGPGLAFLDDADGTRLTGSEVFVASRALAGSATDWMTVTAAVTAVVTPGLLLVPDVPEQQPGPARRRAVYDTAFTSRQLARFRARERIAAGEQARVRKGTGGVNLLIADGSALVSTGPLQGVLYQDAGTVARIRDWAEDLWEESAPFGRPSDLPPLQHLILDLLADGYQPAGIGRELGITTDEARKHVRALLRRLGARTMIQAGMLSRELGWID